MRPLPNVGAKRLGALIASLDSDDLGTREKASKALASLGAAAEPALRQALAGGPAPEVRRRIARLLKAIQGKTGECCAPWRCWSGWTAKGDGGCSSAWPAQRRERG